MTAEPDSANAAIRPPIALVLTIVAALVAERIISLPLFAASAFVRGLGALLLSLGLALAIWAIVTFRRSGTAVQTSKPTSLIVENGPYRLTRNPIYLGMLALMIGLALSAGTAWLLLVMIPFYAVIRLGVIAREEAYLERKFGAAYRDYKSRVRRWL